ncbi:uncharacterized protein N7483_008873 [Penicillium malachiteum]|uniref:uncharacterized protein n=1 Tax=Penicillium malachiteum TaxID=1324776 RepID=UPI0025496581|nr:uncharacterized protein N7483_008873 [Penicillium malachiteum]KAJ5720939.1 hypothetical protein N7483_008873 [Penicillium malachiteum]
MEIVKEETSPGAVEEMYSSAVNELSPSPGPPMGFNHPMLIWPSSGSFNKDVHFWKTEEFGYFYPDYRVTAKHIETKYQAELGMHVNIFHNVEAFVDQVRGFLQFKPENLIRDNLHLCLRGEALGWYNTELDCNEREDLSEFPLEHARGWCGRITSRFSLSLTRTRLYLVCGASGDTICETARNIVHYARAAGVKEPYHHMLQIMRYLKHTHPAHAACIETPTPYTMFTEFMQQLYLAEQNVFSDSDTDDSSMTTDTWVGLDEGLLSYSVFKKGI